MRRFLVPGFLVAQALAVWVVAGTERPPAMPDLARFPIQLGEWTRLAEDATAAEMMGTAKPDRLLSRYYTQRQTGATAHLLVAWYQSQRGGNRQPHQPKVCLLGSGWLPVSEGEMRVETTSGALTARRYLVSRRREQAAILYWYQTPRRALAGEWEAKLWLALDAARDYRTDAALVRIVVPVTSGEEAQAFAAAAQFARSAYPVLRKHLPR